MTWDTQHIPSPPLWYWGQPAQIIPVATDPYNSDRSAADTVCRMKQLTLQASRSPLIRSTVQTILANAYPQSQLDMVRALYWWVKSHVHFREDEDIAEATLGYTREELTSVLGSIDLLIAPEMIVSMPQPEGDCDDFSMLLGSMLIVAGFKVWFVTVACDPMQPQRLSHIYLKTVVDGRFTAVDASHGRYVGWETKNAFRRVEWEVN